MNSQPERTHCAAPTQAMWCDSGLRDNSLVSGPMPQMFTMSRAFANRVLSECMTHFGMPVVPEVKAR